MAKAELIDDREFERDYKLSNGQIITLKLSDDLSQITFWLDGRRLGNDEDFCFKDLGDYSDGYLLARMYIPIKGMGLGRAALEFFTEITKMKVYVRPNDGISRDDGSYLTEDAPGFVHKMRKEGLIEKEIKDPDDENAFEDFST